MRAIHYLTIAALASALLVQPAAAQNKAAQGKANAEFYKQVNALSASVTDLGKRITTASPNDREMLKLIVNQLSVVNASTDAVLDLGALTVELRDAGDIAIVRKHLATRCESFRASLDATAKYLGSVSANIAAVATAAEVGKTRELLVQMGQTPVCGPASKR